MGRLSQKNEFEWAGWKKVRNQISYIGCCLGVKLYAGFCLWTDWKTTIRKKVAHNKAEVTAIAGGEFSCQTLSVMEELIAVLCGIYVAVDGIENATAYGTFLEEEEVIPETPPNTNTKKKNYINAKKGHTKACSTGKSARVPQRTDGC